jgi:hypothetical protein
VLVRGGGGGGGGGEEEGGVIVQGGTLRPRVRGGRGSSGITVIPE